MSSFFPVIRSTSPSYINNNNNNNSSTRQLVFMWLILISGCGVSLI